MSMVIDDLVHMLIGARYTVALTGAGVSTDSGIPDFRSPSSGLWQKYSPMQVASLEGFCNNPVRFYEFWNWRFAQLTSAMPNITHQVLAELEERCMIRAVITQNIDGLHRAAGSQRVLEAHGNFMRGLCMACSKLYAIQEVFAKVQRQRIPLCDGCGHLLRPDVVLFGEVLPPVFEVAIAEVERSDLLWVLGTSLEVYPVAGLVSQAKQRGTKILMVNREPTPLDNLADLVIHSELRAVMTQVRRALVKP